METVKQNCFQVIVLSLDETREMLARHHARTILSCDVDVLTKQILTGQHYLPDVLRMGNNDVVGEVRRLGLAKATAKATGVDKVLCHWSGDNTYGVLWEKVECSCGNSGTNSSR